MDDRPMTVIEHLEELRRRIIYSALSVVIGVGVAWYYSERVLDFLIRPAGKVFLIGVAEGFLLQFRVAVYLGLALASPVILYHALAFFLPAFEVRSRKPIIFLIPAFILLFSLGIGFAWFVFLPFALKFFLGFGTARMEMLVSARSYLDFLAGFVLPFGFVFEMPLVAGLLTQLGVISHRLLIRLRKYAILVIFIVAAILTPPDVVSQVAMALPMLGLYELSVLVSWIVRRRVQALADDG